MAEKPVSNRSSEGVVAIRHPRTDFPQMGWLSKATITFYEPNSGFGWFSETQSFRPNQTKLLYGDRRGPNRAFYQTQPSEVYDPSVLARLHTSWSIPSERTRAHPARDLDRWDQADANFDVINFSQAFDPATQDWRIDTARTSQKLGKFIRETVPDNAWMGDHAQLSTWHIPADRMVRGPRYRLDTNTNVSWIFPNIPAVFDPAIQDWTIGSDRIRTRARRPSDQQPFVPFFDPSTYNWSIESVRANARRRVSRETNTDISWIFPTPIQGWTQSTDRTAPGPRYRRDTNVDVSWIFPTLPYDPAIQDWHIDSGTSRRRRWWSDSPLPAAWLVPSVVFDPALWPGTTSHSHRLWKAPKGRWQPDLDNAWIPPFDATTQFAAIGIPGTRTPARARLQMSRYQSLYDMSFVPVTGFIRLRPIAPIMSARRRNKRR